MHNCKATRDSIIELVLDGTVELPGKLLTELQCCSECSREFEALKDTLSVTNTMFQSLAPSENYWSAYHTRLKERLVTANASAVHMDHRSSLLSRIFGMSVRVPLPIGALVLLIFGVAMVFVARGASPQVPTEPLIVRVPVEVPVVQEKVVTRTVYRDRYRPRFSRKSDDAKNKVSNSTLARSERKDVDGPQSLLGFKPLDEIKLTVIKKGSANDK